MTRLAATLILALIPLPTLAQNLTSQPSAIPNRGGVYMNILPPPEYDRTYTGKLSLITAKTEEEVRTLCPSSVFKVGYALGCSSHNAVECRIVLAAEHIITSYGWTYETVLRHELGHCNGWPATHLNARPAFQKAY